MLFDVSESMRDLAAPDGPSKISLAKAALENAFDQLAPEDDVGLRVFTTKLANPVSPDWRDVVPTGPLAQRKPALLKAVSALTPQQGSPLYAATRDAYDAAARAAAPSRINGVVLVTDGYNEDDHDTNLKALLAHLGTNPDIHIFTIAYSSQSDLATLHKIANATNASTYDAQNAPDIADELPPHARELLAGRFPVHVRLDEDERGARLRGANVDLEVVDRLCELGYRQAQIELDLGRDHDLVRAEVLGPQMDATLHRGERLDRGTDALHHLGAGRLPDEQAPHLDHQHDRDDDEEDPDRKAADTVPTRVAGGIGDHDSRRARSRGRRARPSPRAAPRGGRDSWCDG